MRFTLRKLSRKKWVILLTLFSFCILLPLEIVYAQASVIETAAQMVNDWLLMLLDKALEYVLLATFLQIILQIILALSNFFIGFAGGLLNWAITLNTTISLTHCTSGVPCIVDAGWTFTRDFANMFFILALVIIAFATILGIESYGMRRLLVPLILIALLINFSQLFIGGLVDFANVFLETLSKPFGDGFALMLKGFQNQTAFFTKAVKGMMVYNFDPTLNFVQNSVKSWIGWLLESLLLAIFNLMLGIVLFLLAGIFLLRIPMLWILTMISPFFIVLYLFPYFRSKFRWWLDQTLQWIFIGVFAMFFLYLAYQLMIIMNDAAFQQQWQYTTFRANLPPEAGGGSLESWLITDILPYVVFVIFLYLSFSFAQHTNAIFAGAVVAGAVALKGQIEGRLRGVTRAGMREIKERRPKAISEEREARARERMAKVPVVGGLLAEREAKKIDQERKEKEKQKTIFKEHYGADTIVAMSKGKEAAALESLAERRDIEKIEKEHPELEGDLTRIKEKGLRRLKNIDPEKYKDMLKRYPKLGGLIEEPAEAEKKMIEAYKKVPRNYVGKEMGKSNFEYLAKENKLDILFAENQAAWGADKFRAVGRRDDVKDVAPIIAEHITAQGKDRATRENYLRSEGREDLITFFDSPAGRRIYGDVLGGRGPTPAGGAGGGAGGAVPPPTPAGGPPPTTPPSPPGTKTGGGKPVKETLEPWARPQITLGEFIPGVKPGERPPEKPPGKVEERGKPVEKVEEKVAVPPKKKEWTKRKILEEAGLAAAVAVFAPPGGRTVYALGKLAPRIQRWWNKRKAKKKEEKKTPRQKTLKEFPKEKKIRGKAEKAGIPVVEGKGKKLAGRVEEEGKPV